MKRSERLVDMVKYLLARPHTLIALPFFAVVMQIAMVQQNLQFQKIWQFYVKL